MNEELVIKLRSKSGAPVRCDKIALALEHLGLEAVAVKTRGTGKRVSAQRQGNVIQFPGKQ